MAHGSRARQSERAGGGTRAQYCRQRITSEDIALTNFASTRLVLRDEASMLLDDSDVRTERILWGGPPGSAAGEVVGGEEGRESYLW